MKHPLHYALALVLLMLSAIGTMAKDEVSNTIQFNNLSFQFDSSLATSVNVHHVPADSETTFPPEPEHITFQLYNALPVPEGLYDTVTVVTVYPIAGIDGFSEYQKQADRLTSLLTAKPDLTEYLNANSTLAFAPVVPHGQAAQSRLHYIEANNLSGIGYITALPAANEPFLSDSFFYTFQGLSSDGQYYVSVIAHLTSDLYPVEAEPIELSFYDHFDEYLQETRDTLNQASLDAFSPSIPAIENLIESLQIK